MSPTALSYDELKQEFEQQLQKTEHGVLATSKGDVVTAREIMTLSDGLKIKCFTGENSRKYKQIKANKNVALSINNLQIEGTATLTGHPLDARNAGFNTQFKEKFPQAYEFWRPLSENPSSDATVIEIIPNRLSAYKVSPGIGPHYDILNVDTKMATRVTFSEIPPVKYEEL
jgi:uncharacterized pyridoxamine 5'-phosphate oxidase family protein